MMKICNDCKIKQAAKGRKICFGCKSRRWRLKYPFEYSYNNLKFHAKARNKSFELTFDEFKEFAIKYDYIDKKGIQRESLHVDRIREEEGYHKDNIQALENHLNVKKYIAYCYTDENNNKIFKTITHINNQTANDDCPF